mmetsp:Transcript_11375/g.20536  ORF Transcript_11375/g.20536 Transcript_11375/m.20536 type:complete len:223 (-) Transcript_11375:248-916(-)
MGNTLPISVPPKPSPSRAVIFMKQQCIQSYLQEPWRKPAGKLEIIGSIEEVPFALDGLVPVEEYREMASLVAVQAATYRGGRIHLIATLFYMCLFIVLIFGFVSSLYTDVTIFLNPVTLGILGTLVLVVNYRSGRFFQQEENTLNKKLLEILHPWRQEYSIVAKLRKTRGQIGGSVDGRDSEGKISSVYYCLVLEKRGPEDDIDTISLSTFTDMESEIDSQV